MDMELRGKVAVVTGGTRGIGRRIVERFVEEGASVVFTGRDAETGGQVQEELSGNGDVRYVGGDIRRRWDAERMVDAAVEEFGRLDVLVNNAGGASHFALAADTDDGTWHDTLALNLHSVFYATRRALTHLLPRKAGRIITISSIEGKHPDPGLAVYATAKHAVIGFTRSLAKEVGPAGITANCVCPGMVMTDFVRHNGPDLASVLGLTYDQLVEAFVSRTSTGRTTTVDEVAAMTVLLASAAGAGITGAALSVDGGMAC